MKPPALVISVLTKLCRVIPTWKIVPVQDIIDIAFKQPEIRKQVRENPYCYKGKPRLKTAYECLRVSTDVENRLSEVALPFIVLHGEDDIVTDKSVSMLLVDKASISDKTIKLYPGMWHGLLYGETPQNINQVFQDIIAWLDRRTGLGNSRLEREQKADQDNKNY